MPEAKTRYRIWMMMRELRREMEKACLAVRSEDSRRWAVAITEYEKSMAYFNTFVVDGYEVADD